MPDFFPSWDVILEFIQKLGWVKGMFALFFWVAHAAYFLMVRGRLKDRQREIDRMAADIADYRNTFSSLILKEMKLKPSKKKGDDHPRS